MLTPDELKVAPDNIVALYQRLEDDIITDIARRLEKAGEITGTAEWQIYMLTEMGKDLDDIKSKIAEVNHKSKAEVENLFDEAIARSVGRDNLLFQKAGKGTLDLAKNAGMQQFIAASAAKTAGDLKNLTKSLGFKDGNQFKPIARFYQDTLNYAQFQVASGAFSYQQAIRISTAKMVESGIRVVDYESGVSTRVDVAVRRATLTGINQTAAQITLMQMGELGGEYVEVTAHAGARPIHADWQGKVYHVGGDVKGYPDFEESTGYGTGDGLCGWNCRHNFHPFFPGISERNYTDKELENIDPPPFEYNGKTYTHYEATQKQRQIERAIRKTKQEMIAYDAAGLKDDFTFSAVKLQRQKELYRDFSAKARLQTKDERHQLFGFGKSASQKGFRAAKEHRSIKHFSKSAGGKSGQRQHLSELIGELDFNDKQSIFKTLSYFEKQIVDEPIEHCITITRDGKVWHTVGSGGLVDPSGILELGSDFMGSYSYHNHPKDQTNFSFSAEDIIFFLESKEKYASASDYKYIYEITRTSDTIEEGVNAVKVRFKELYLEVIDNVSENRNDPGEYIYHEIIKILSDEYKFDYSRRLKNER